MIVCSCSGCLRPRDTILEGTYSDLDCLESLFWLFAWGICVAYKVFDAIPQPSSTSYVYPMKMGDHGFESWTPIQVIERARSGGAARTGSDRSS